LEGQPLQRRVIQRAGGCAELVTICRSRYIDNVYTLHYNSIVAKGIEFDWDAENTKHLAAHKITPAEFEQAMSNDPLDRDFELIGDEERFRSVGLTDAGRLLSVVWIVRNGRVRAVTAFPAGVADTKAFLERSQ
jgi:uncharacterized DUF497 family protein